MRFNFAELLSEAFRQNRGWTEQWPSVAPKTRYDAVIIGGGGHGLAAAYYLATEHGLKNIAVLERAWLGGGNTGRNTTIVRSNYLLEESAALYDHAMSLWRNLSQTLNYNVMYSPRGVLTLAHSLSDIRNLKRHIHANRLAGIDNEWLEPEEAKSFCPPLNVDRAVRYPIEGAALQRIGGTARHDAVAWGYARAAASLDVDIAENCEVTGIRRAQGGAVCGVDTTCGTITTPKIGIAVAGHSSRLLAMAGLHAPIESFPLQALVSEPLKSALPCVVISNTLQAYVSQSDKGELVIGGQADAYASYTQRGALHVTAHTVEALCELFPSFRRLRMMRNWAGIVDITPDRSPIIGKTEVKGLYIDCGWGTGGFKATPAAGRMLAWTMAKDEPHPLNAPFNFDRFRTGRLINEAAAAGVTH
jgi:sarcosine oxidase subunit beta